MTDKYGRHILITGASSGLGLACAELYAINGYDVWGVSRFCEISDYELGNGMIHTRRMDVNDDESIEQIISEILSKTKRIGTVIHCAGFGIAGAAAEVPVSEAKKQLETNYFGVLRLNRFILPIMRKQKMGLILVIGSVAGLITIPFQSHYSSSKYALEAYVEALRMENRQYGINVSLIEPGDTNTGFTTARIMCMAESSPYHQDCIRAVEKMAKDERNGKSPDTVAKAALKVSKMKNPPIRKIVGLDYQLLIFLKRILPSRTVEYLVRKIYLG